MSTKFMATELLKAMQLDSLKERFGDDYLNKFKRVKKSEEGYIQMLEKISRDKNDFEELKKYNDERSSIANVLSTEYEIVNSSKILAVLCPEIEETIKRLGYKITMEVYFGVTSSGDYNANADKIPGTPAYIITLEDEIFTLCNMISKVIIRGLPIRNANDTLSISFKEDAIKKHISETRDLQMKFNDLIIWGLLGGKPTHTQQYFLKENLWPLHHQLYRSAELFILGHEYGHIIAGHLDEIKRKNNRGKRVEVIRCWQQEFEADCIGLELMVNSVERDPMGLSYLGAELFFAFLDLDHRVNTFYYGDKEEACKGSEKHPPTGERKSNVRRMIKEVLTKDWKDVYVVMSTMMDIIIESLWENVKPRILEYKEMKKDKFCSKFQLSFLNLR